MLPSSNISPGKEFSPHTDVFQSFSCFVYSAHVVKTEENKSQFYLYRASSQQRLFHGTFELEQV